jgi:uncharacterized membrane protein
MTSQSRRRGTFVVIGLTAYLLLPPGALAQTQAAPGQDATANDAAKKAASVSRSAIKATTYKIGTATINLTLLSFAVGSIAGGGILAAGTAATSWLVYTANDYMWDTYSPAPVKEGAEEGFDASASAWRTTLKYLTFKPLGMGQKFVWLYAYTGSAATMMTWGTITAAVNTAWFYANDMGWDWYDWYSAAPATAPR